MNEFKTGQRIVCDSCYGTVRYIGPVPPTEGIWLGVEWDDSSRGKHNGTHEGHQYFVTRYSTSGSFIRPKKADPGVTCLQAIREQYSNAKHTITKSHEDLYLIMANNSILPVHSVGFDKMEKRQSQLDKLTDVCLASKRVSTAGPENELKISVPNIVELDLSKTLLNSWEDVSKIGIQLHRLRILNLSCNLLELPENVEKLKKAFLMLEVIILHYMNYTWKEVLDCSGMWPNIKKLHVSFNKISTIELPKDSFFEFLEELHLDSNPIRHWSEIMKLGKLPRLKLLNLNSTGMSGIHIYHAQTVPSSFFPLLETLHLQNNELKQWSDIDELNKLPALNSITILHNPIFDSDEHETVCQIIIAKLSGLQFLNRGAISPSERRGAELDYIKKYGKDWFASKGAGSENSAKLSFHEKHPRYQHLISVHGAPEESELKIQSSALKNQLISVEIECSSELKDNTKSMTKKLPGNLTIQKLKGLVQRLFKLESTAMTIRCVSSKKPSHKVEMNNELRELSFYVEDGDKILICQA